MPFERVHLRMPDGQEYGPAAMQEVIDWHAQGRVPREASLVDADTGEVRPVTDFPALVVPVALEPYAAPPSAPSGEPTAMDRMIPAKNGSALVGYYCGIFGIIPCFSAILGPLALIFGIIGLRKVRETGVGKGHAITAIILGGLETLVSLAGIVLMIIGALQG